MAVLFGNRITQICIGILSLAVWVILKPRISLSNSSTAVPNPALFKPSLKNASQTKGEFQLTLILPRWHSFSSGYLKFKACPGFKYTF